jgi:hypothetical protein
MQPQPPDAPVLRVVARQAEPDLSRSRVDPTSADVSLEGGGRMRARRGGGVIRFALPVVPSDADLLHPYLAVGAALAWQWEGREALHGGAIATAAGAALVFGDKQSGKSTTLARLAERGVTVMSDDAAVIHGDRVLAGPRSIDLRSNGFPAGGAPVRDGRRVRVSLPTAPAAAPVAASVVLRWGPEVAVSPVSPRERLKVLAGQRTFFKLDGDPGSLLELASRPMFTLTRPRDPEALPMAAAALLACCA